MRGTSSNMISALPHAHLYGQPKASGGVRAGTPEVQVVIRSNEYCERCGAKNPFRRKTERRDAGNLECFAVNQLRFGNVKYGLSAFDESFPDRFGGIFPLKQGRHARENDFFFLCCGCGC